MVEGMLCDLRMCRHVANKYSGIKLYKGLIEIK